MIFIAALALIQMSHDTHRIAKPASSHQRVQNQKSRTTSVRRFVQDFYDWYIVYMSESEKKNPNVDPQILTIKLKPDAFNPELRRALLDDRVAQSKSSDVVGIDFDPFLGGQDPAKHYRVGKVERRGNSWLVSVWSSYGKQAHAPDVVAMVEKADSKYGWRFSNFIYGKEGDLRKILRVLKHDRER